MLNEVVYSAMNQGLIITIFDDVNPDMRSFWFFNEKDAARYPDDLLEQIRPADLEEIGGEFCYCIVDGHVVASYKGVA